MDCLKRILLFALSVLVFIFVITWPTPVSAKSSIDIVFIIDRSDSMSPSINGVKNNVNRFADLLSERGISYRLGLVTYEKDVTRYNLTSDVDELKNQVSRISVSGGTENGLDAIMEAGQNYPFDVDATKYFILIGDENIYSRNGYTDASVIQYLKDKKITMTVIGTRDIRTQLTKFTDQTGGQYLDLNSDFGQSLTKIFEQIQRIPTLEIVSPKNNQILSGTTATFVPSVKVTDPDSDQLRISYYIDGDTTPRDVRTVTNTSNEQLVQFNAVSVSSLSEGQHTMRFHAHDGTDEATDTVTFKVDKNPPVIAQSAITTTATSIRMTGSATDNIAGLHATPYRYSIGSKSSGWTKAAFFTATDLTPNTSYELKLEARDAVELTSSKTYTAITNAQVPVMQVGTIDDSSIELLFEQDANPEGTAYQIQVGSQYVSASGTLTNLPGWITLTNKKTTITGLAANTRYSIRAKAKNGNQVETALNASQAVSTIALPPADIVFNREQKSIKISWKPVAGVSGYEIELDGNVEKIGNVTNYTHGGLQPNTRHTYRVRSLNASGASVWSKLEEVYTLSDPPGIPTGVTASPSQTFISLSWDAVAKAERYEVEANGAIHDAGTKLSFKHEGLSSKMTYQYRVRAINEGGIGNWSNMISFSTLPYPPQVPKNLAAEITKNEIKLTWAQTEEADGYELEVDGLIVDMKQNHEYVHKGLKPLSGHTYRVRAVNTGGKSSWSEPLNVVTHPDKPVRPTNIMTTSDPNKITLMWYEVSHAEDYEVEIDGTEIVTVTELQYVHEDLRPESKHSYRIRARNISGYSEWTTPVTMETFPASSDGQNYSLTNMAAVVTNQAITITWDTVAVDAQYEIEVDGVLSDLGYNTIYHHGGLKANEFHSYKIRLKTEGSSGRWVAVLSLSTLSDPPDAPTALEGFGLNNKIELRWDSVNGAAGYDLEVDGQIVDAGNADSYTHKDLEAGTSHTYRLRAKNETGVTAWSPSIIRSTTSPTYVVNAKAGKTFDLSLLAFNVQDFSELTFVVTYDDSQLEVTDLYQFTPKPELMSSGTIANSGLTVTHTPGRVTYKLSKNIVPGTSWSGEVVTLVFKAKKDGQANINVVIE